MSFIITKGEFNEEDFRKFLEVFSFLSPEQRFPSYAVSRGLEYYEACSPSQMTDYVKLKAQPYRSFKFLLNELKERAGE